MLRFLVRPVLLLAATIAVLLLPATAQAAEAPKDVLLASVTEVGVVNLAYATPLGSQVDFRERVGDRVKALGVATATVESPPTAFLLGAVRWRCDRLVRRFEAVAITPDGSRSGDIYDIRTPSCAKRLKLSVPRRVARGSLVRVRVHDRWTNGGIKPRLCITPPRGVRSCRVLEFPRAVDLAGRDFRPRKRGLWRVELKLEGHRVRAAVAVGGGHAESRSSLPTLLTTGDSGMQGIDSYLADRLAKTRNVRTELHHGTSISKSSEWQTRAVAQVKRYHQRTTVVSLGGVEGYPMQTPDGATRECCDELWAEEYSRRVRVMMKTYRRGGKARVLWLTSPTPRDPELAAQVTVVNGALLRAAEGQPGVKMVRLDAIFTPNGYREYMPYRGQNVRVRNTDGGHLTATGTAIAAEAIEKALR